MLALLFEYLVLHACFLDCQWDVCPYDDSHSVSLGGGDVLCVICVKDFKCMSVAVRLT